MSQNGNSALATRADRKDVIEGEVMSSGAITPALTMVLDLNEMEKRYKLLQEFINRLMKEGHDYGKIPGTGDKPTLLLPGAHKLNAIYGLSPLVEVMEAIEDFEGGFLKYNVKVKLMDKRNGQIVAEGIGSCNTLERRYANPIRNGKQTAADYANTCLKMAKKRALVDATLTATGTSGIFEQDLDDDPGNGDNSSHPNSPRRPQSSNSSRYNSPRSRGATRDPDYNRPAAAIAVDPCTQSQVDEIWRLAEDAYNGPKEARRVLAGWLDCNVEDLSRVRAVEVIEQLERELERQSTAANGQEAPQAAAPQAIDYQAPSNESGGQYSSDESFADDSDPFADE